MQIRQPGLSAVLCDRYYMWTRVKVTLLIPCTPSKIGLTGNCWFLTDDMLYGDIILMSSFDQMTSLWSNDITMIKWHHFLALYSCCCVVCLFLRSMARCGAVLRKLICISRSVSHLSESEVMCLITFLGVPASREELYWYRILHV